LSLGRTGREPSHYREKNICKKAKGPFVEGKCLVIQRDFQQGRGERFEEQQRERSGGKTARDYSSGTSVKDFQICLQCLTE